MSDLIASAWQAITRHRLRSLLAVAGVAVAVCALTATMSVEKAWRSAVADFFSGMDLATVRVRIAGAGEWRRLGYSRPSLEPADAQALAESCPAVKSATMMTRAMLPVEHEGAALETTVRAVDADFCDTLPDEVREGRLFTPVEAAERQPLCVLTRRSRLALFGDEQAIGRYVRIGEHRFQILGVIAGKGHFSIGPEAVYVPASWSRLLLQSTLRPSSLRTEIFVRTEDPRTASAQIDHVLQRRIGGGEHASFTSSLWEVRGVALHARSRATLYIGLAAICALLAAGIGIAALLLVSVSERSREIGIARALGASRATIYGEHVLAALLLCAGGGLMGTLAGAPAAVAGVFATRWQPVLPSYSEHMLGHGLAQFPKMSEIALSVAWEAVAISLALALLTGGMASFAPASEAASMTPAHAIAQRPGTRRRLRDVLTCLQLAFGVLVLVVLTSYFGLLQSEERAEARQQLGDDKVLASADPVAAMRKPVSDRERTAYARGLADVLAVPENLAALREQTPLMKDLAPVVPLSFDIAYGARTAQSIQVILTTAEYFGWRTDLTDDALARADAAFRQGLPVLVIDPGVREDLFGDRDGVGNQVSVAGSKFTVVAVRGARGDSYHNGTAWLPISFYQSLRHRAGDDPPPRFHGVRTGVRARPIDERRYVEAAAQLREALLPMLPEEVRGGIWLSEHIPATMREFLLQHKAAAARGAVSALAVLLVALIGLVNMLLVSVHDELRETGVRRALGAQRPDIFLHFLSRGVLLSVVGGAVGLAVGSAICLATRNWVGLPISVSVFWAAAGATATVVVGAVVSVIPAFIGARVSPVEALRYE